jgi:hypothetical protein
MKQQEATGSFTHIQVLKRLSGKVILSPLNNKNTGTFLSKLKQWSFQKKRDSIYVKNNYSLKHVA